MKAKERGILGEIDGHYTEEHAVGAGVMSGTCTVRCNGHVRRLSTVHLRILVYPPLCWQASQRYKPQLGRRLLLSFPHHQ